MFESELHECNLICIILSFCLALDIVSDSAMGVELGSQMRNPDSLDYVQNRSEACHCFLIVYSKSVIRRKIYMKKNWFEFFRFSG